VTFVGPSVVNGRGDGDRRRCRSPGRARMSSMAQDVIAGRSSEVHRSCADLAFNL